jgi:hypothetical protein
VKVAVVPERVTAPATGVPPAMSVNVVVPTDVTASLNVAVTAAATGTAVAPPTGFVELTVGGVVSVGVGVLPGSPGKVLAVISAMLVNPSPSESRDSTFVILVVIATPEPNDRIAWP